MSSMTSRLTMAACVALIIPSVADQPCRAHVPAPCTLYDVIALGIDVKETGHPATIQERAYSSSIWYTR